MAIELKYYQEIRQSVDPKAGKVKGWYTNVIVNGQSLFSTPGKIDLEQAKDLIKLF